MNSSRIFQFYSVLAVILAVAVSSFGQAEAVLKPGDSLLITVYQEDELTTETKISPSGEITFPLIGQVKLGGLTIAEAVADIAGRLDPGFVVDPKVTITVTGMALQKATVVGAVKAPGFIELPAEGGLDLLGAISLAGGYREDANPQQVTVRRKAEGKDEIRRFDAEAMIIDPNIPPFMIQGGDMIIVGQEMAERVSVMGQVQKAGAIDIPKGVTLDVLSAISMAGGYSELANPCHVTIKRRVGSGSEVYQVDAQEMATRSGAKPFMLQANDVVIVSEKSKSFVTVLGEVHRPSMVPIPPGVAFDLLDAIASAGGFTDSANRRRILVKRRVDGEEKVYRVDGRRLSTDSTAEPFRVYPNDSITVSERIF